MELLLRQQLNDEKSEKKKERTQYVKNPTNTPIKVLSLPYGFNDDLLIQ